MALIIDAMLLKPEKHEFNVHEQPFNLRYMNITGGGKVLGLAGANLFALYSYHIIRRRIYCFYNIFKLLKHILILSKTTRPTFSALKLKT